MPLKEMQRTIREPVSFSGIGLHTGNLSTITFHPAPEDYGYRFVRTDLPNAPEIPAVVDYVVDRQRWTVLGIEEVRVHTVEHVLAALVGLQIDNCRIELTANEPPIGDGSALPFVEVLLQAGIEEQSKPRDFLVVDRTVHYSNEEKGVDLVALPLDDFRVTVMIDYANPALGSQHTGLFDLEKEFVESFAPARTFAFLTEIEQLRAQGLIKGGRLDNAIVIVDKPLSDAALQRLAEKLGLQESVFLGDNGILNNKPLRFKNEPARHKLLDLLGDLALVGAPIKAQILAARPGHAHNVEFAKKLRQLYLKQKLVRKYQAKRAQNAEMDIAGILQIMPHRYPFLLIDRIVRFDHEEQRVIGYKNVSINEPFFQGHFPGKPLMPGVLIIEAMAQASGLLILHSDGFQEGKLVVFTGIDKARFRKPVVPGDRLFLDVKLIGKRFNTFVLDAKAIVDDHVVAQAELRATVVNSEDV